MADAEGATLSLVNFWTSSDWSVQRSHVRKASSSFTVGRIGEDGRVLPTCIGGGLVVRQDVPVTAVSTRRPPFAPQPPRHAHSPHHQGHCRRSGKHASTREQSGRTNAAHPHDVVERGGSFSHSRCHQLLWYTTRPVSYILDVQGLLHQRSVHLTSLSVAIV